MVIIDHMSSKSTFGANNVSNYLSMEYHDHEVMCRNILDGKIMMMCQISLRREYHDPTDGGKVCVELFLVSIDATVSAAGATISTSRLTTQLWW